MKNFFPLLIACIFVTTSQAQLVNVVNEVAYTDGDNPAALFYPAGHVTYRVYAELADNIDAVTAVYADGDNSLAIGSNEGLHWNSEFGAITGDALNVAFFGAFPSAEWDSVVTIGRSNDSDGLTGGVTAVSVLPSATAIQDAMGTSVPTAPEFDGPLVLQDGTWFTTPDNTAALGQGPNNRVLLAQLTIPQSADLEYSLNIQLLDGGQGGSQIKYVWDENADDGPNEQYFPGLSYPPPGTPGCTDAGSCNYNAAATTDDGSCDGGAIGCDSCVGGPDDGTGSIQDNPEPGEACDDGDAGTFNDTIQADCSCSGSAIALPTSALDYPAGNYDFCDLIKADWVGADDYRFNFTPQSGGATLSVEQGGANTFLQLLTVAGLAVGETYDVTVDALFGSNWSIGSVATPITVVAPAVAVNPDDNCANNGPHFYGDYISAKPFVCGGDKWEWTFAPSTGGLPIVYTRNSSNRFIRLSSITGLMPGETYDVTVRAGYPNGSFTAMSTVECISIIGTAPSAGEGPVETEFVEVEREVAEPTAAIYPNPNNGDFLNVNLTGVENSKVTIDIVNSFGSFVDRIELNVANGSVNEIVHLNGLASGVYLVNITMDNTVVTERLVIQK